MKNKFYAVISLVFFSQKSTAGVSVGATSTKYTISVAGVVNKSYAVSAIGFDLYTPITQEVGGNVFFEREGQKYIGGGGGIRYFPWSLSGLQEKGDKYLEVRYQDDFKPYLRINMGFGRLRLLSDAVGANEIGIGLNNFDVTMGAILGLGRWHLGSEVGYGYANTTSDSVLAVTSVSKTIFRLAAYYEI